MDILDNKKDKKVGDVLKKSIKKDARLSILSAIPTKTIVVFILLSDSDFIKSANAALVFSFMILSNSSKMKSVLKLPNEFNILTNWFALKTDMFEI